MKLRKPSWLGRAKRLFKAKLRPGIPILLYHRVAELTSDPVLLSVRPVHFSEQMEVLRKLAVPISLQQLIHALRTDRLPNRAVVITFDDGYRDNLYAAKPVLEQYEIPATVFVATTHIDEEVEFWWDEMERILLQPGELPSTLSVSINGSQYEWKLDAAAYYSHEAYGTHQSWNILNHNDPTKRQKVYRSIHDLLRPLGQAARLQVVEQLRAQAGVTPTARPSHRILTSNEIAELVSENLVDVGAHTVTHPLLSALSVTEQRSEISSSKSRLEEILNFPIKSFSYPYGSQSDYTPETVSLVQEAGFAYACANIPKVVHKDSDLFQLPRFIVRDWDGDRFLKHLRYFLPVQR